MTSTQQAFEVMGMHCGGCAGKIRTALLAVSGVSGARVSHESGAVDVDTEMEIDPSVLVETIESSGDYTATHVEKPKDRSGEMLNADAMEEPKKESLYPLFLIVGFIAGVTLLIAYSNEVWSIETMMRHFMAGFFLVFSFFKLLDTPGFVSAYRGYDLIAKKIPAWGWVYPFVELGLGVAYLLALMPTTTNVITLVLMLVGAAGVLNALLNKRVIRCACLGTALNLPMTKVTLVEDLTMAVMAGAMLLIL